MSGLWSFRSPQTDESHPSPFDLSEALPTLLIGHTVGETEHHNDPMQHSDTHLLADDGDSADLGERWQKMIAESADTDVARVLSTFGHTLNEPMEALFDMQHYVTNVDDKGSTRRGEPSYSFRGTMQLEYEEALKLSKQRTVAPNDTPKTCKVSSGKGSTATHRDAVSSRGVMRTDGTRQTSARLNRALCLSTRIANAQPASKRLAYAFEWPDPRKERDDLHEAESHRNKILLRSSFAPWHRGVDWHYFGLSRRLRLRHIFERMRTAYKIKQMTQWITLQVAIRKAACKASVVAYRVHLRMWIRWVSQRRTDDKIADRSRRRKFFVMWMTKFERRSTHRRTALQLKALRERPRSIRLFVRRWLRYAHVATDRKLRLEIRNRLWSAVDSTAQYSIDTDR